MSESGAITVLVVDDHPFMRAGNSKRAFVSAPITALVISAARPMTRAAW